MDDYDVASRPRVFVSRVEEALRERGVNLPCPRCGNRDFSVLDGVVLLDSKSVAFGILYVSSPDPIPLVVVFCTKCGYKFEHLVEILDVDLDTSRGEEE